MVWIRRVLIPLAVVLVVLGVIFRLFNVNLFGLGISPGSYIALANAIFLFVIAWMLIRIEGKSDIF